MISSDYGEFSSEIRRMGTVFRLRTTPAELTQLTDAYFAALQRFTILQIINACEAWTARETKFPKPAELASVAPRRTVEIQTLSESQAFDWLHAEQHRWQDQPCVCAECVQAEVHEKPLRFVPDDAQVRIGDREVTAGHWAHGFELKRWYKARADFYDKCLSLGLRGDVLKPKRKKSTFKQRMDAIFWKAQGEDPAA